ncbi:hypothetical protein PPERSA_06064 [Pseudocohnilembus persalinus]|uniref:Amine oxidase domain-containing protein n=1 Tax=Pseudocohnilembus persalinus TaxID=266149 RepID=A0A0V0QVG0_PSEPJ|nr:hypothetical protein PPERSA_06064 [Pseudocohnilembus persalinus]|eukprot:KRX06182.1 hypothetical protein PPERSA_06064 [Pseudocohnilembus persalinus]
MDRVGGRVFTTETGVDLGASWVHQWQHKDNTVRKLIEKLNVPVVGENSDQEVLEDFFDQVSQTRVDPAIIMKAQKHLDRIIEISIQKASKLKRDVSIYDCVKEELQQIDNMEDELYKRVFYQFLAQCLNNEAATLKELSAKMGVGNPQTNENQKCSVRETQDNYSYKDYEDKIIQQGYGNLFQDLSQNLNIKLNSEVQEINYIKNQTMPFNFQIKVYNNKTQQTEFFYAKYLLVTCSIKVLQNDVISFQPELSQQKQKAIKKLGLGQANKVVLEFEKCFWDERIYSVCLAQQKENFADFPIFYNMKKYKNKNILMALLSDDQAIISERKTDQELVDSAISKLQQVYQKNYPEFDDSYFKVKNYYVTRWGANKFIQGAYAYYPVGANHEDSNELLVPEYDNNLYFAGDATIADLIGTANASSYSGEQQAEHIIQKYMFDQSQEVLIPKL